ncbi:MAG: YfiR family protein [Nibricoccus sp.]
MSTDTKLKPSTRTLRILAPKSLWPFLVAGSLLALTALHGQKPSEYEAKALHLLNVARFVEWPSSALPAEQPLVIGIIGEDPFGEQLPALLAGEAINGHRLEVKRFSKSQTCPACHILFVGKSEAARLDEILQAVQGKAILTISDIDRFAHNGGMIAFLWEHGRLEMEINVPKAEGCRLSISAKLLRLSSVITEPPSCPPPLQGSPRSSWVCSQPPTISAGAIRVRSGNRPLLFWPRGRKRFA